MQQSRELASERTASKEQAAGSDGAWAFSVLAAYESVQWEASGPLPG